MERPPCGQSGFGYSTKYSVLGSNLAILPVFVCTKYTIPDSSVVIANGCVQSVGILYSVTYELDFALLVPQNLGLSKSGKLSAGVPVTVDFVSGFCTLGLEFSASAKVDVIKITAKNPATMIPFFFTSASFAYRIISILGFIVV
jgi:hypothetical protein